MEAVGNGTRVTIHGSRRATGWAARRRAALVAVGAVLLSCDDGATGPENAPPTALDVTVEVARGLPVTFPLAATDPDGDPLTYEVLTSPRRGRLTLVGGTAGDAEATYTPDADFVGVDVFTFRVSDGEVSGVGTVTLDVAARAPELGNTDAVASRPAGGGPATVRLVATDPDGDPATFEVTTQPAHGTLSAVVIVSGAGAGPSPRAASEGTTTVGELTYTPDEGFEGDDAFGFRASDGTWTSPEGFVTITVNGVPEALNGVAETGKGDAVAITLTGVDPDGDALEFEIVGTPAHGMVVVLAPSSGTAGAAAMGEASAVYTPDPGYTGQDAFTFLATDGLDESEPAEVTVEVVNGQPVAEAAEATVAKNQPAEVLLRGTDPDGDPLTFEIVDGPENGTLSGPASAAGGTASAAEDPSSASEAASSAAAAPASSAATFVYTPDPGVSGPDAFTFRVSDGEDESEPAAFEVTVTNVAPSAVTPAPVEVAAGGEVTLALSGSDPDGDPLTFEVSSPPAEGSVVSITPTGPTSADLVYRAGATPALQAFEVVASDGTDAGAPVTVQVRVDGPPAAADQAVSTDEDAPLGITLTGFDPEGTDLAFEIVTPPEHGALGPLAPGGAPVAEAAVTYTPAAGYGGPDVFTFRVIDAFGLTAEATVSITVEPVNDIPTADDEAYVTDEDEVLAVPAPGVLDGDADPDGDPLTAALLAGPEHGALTLNDDGSFSYTPDADFHGPDGFTYLAGDGTAASAPATVTLTVNPVNDPPVADEEAYSVDEDATLVVPAPGVLDGDADADGDPLEAILADPPSHGVVTLDEDGSFTYTPAPDYSGTDVFTYRTSDGASFSDPATVEITVNAVNEAPEAGADAFLDLFEGDVATLPVLANDTDEEGDPLTIAGVGTPACGAVTHDGTALTYTAGEDLGTVCAESFTYTVSDGGGGTGEGTVTFGVRPDDAAGLEDAPIVLTLSAAGDWAGPGTFVVTITEGLHESDGTTTGLGALYQYTDAALAALEADITDVGAATPLAAGDAVTDEDFRVLYVPPQHKNTETALAHLEMKPELDYVVAEDGGGFSAAGSVAITVEEVNDVPAAWGQPWTTVPEYWDVYLISGTPGRWREPDNSGSQTDTCYGDCVFFEDFGARFPAVPSPRGIFLGGQDIELSDLAPEILSIVCAPGTELFDGAGEPTTAAELTAAPLAGQVPGSLASRFTYRPKYDDFNQQNPNEGRDAAGGTPGEHHCRIEYLVVDEDGARSPTNVIEIKVIQKNDIPRDVGGLGPTLSTVRDQPLAIPIDATDAEGDGFEVLVTACGADAGSFHLPAANQHDFIAADGTLDPADHDDAFEDTPLDCSALPGSPVHLPNTHAETGGKGWYVLFVPGPGETGAAYNTLRYLLYDGITPLDLTFATVRTIDVTASPDPLPPTLTGLSAASGVVGTTVAQTLTGTNFVAGGTTVTVNSGGVTVENVDVTSTTSLTADFVIAADASLGDHTVKVTTADGTSDGQTFEVLPPPPTITSITPGFAFQGESVDVTITGTDFVPDETTLTLGGSGVTASNVSVVSDTEITATFAVGAAATFGNREVTVTTPGGTSVTEYFLVAQLEEVPDCGNCKFKRLLPPPPEGIPPFASRFVQVTMEADQDSVLFYLRQADATGGEFPETGRDITNLSGTLAVTGGSNVLTGTNTSFMTEVRAPGHVRLSFSNSNCSDNTKRSFNAYVLSVDSPTRLTVAFNSANVPDGVSCSGATGTFEHVATAAMSTGRDLPIGADDFTIHIIECQPGAGAIYKPTSTQFNNIDPITPALAPHPDNFFEPAVTCFDLQQGELDTVFPASRVKHRGWWFNFKRDSIETGPSYNWLAVLVQELDQDSQFIRNTPYYLVYFLINIRPSAP